MSSGRHRDSDALNGCSNDFNDTLQRSLSGGRQNGNNKSSPNSLLSNHLDQKNKKPQNNGNKCDYTLKSSASETFQYPSKRYNSNHVDTFNSYSNSESEDEKFKSDLNNNDLNDYELEQVNGKNGGVSFRNTNGSKQNDLSDGSNKESNKETEGGKTRVNYTDILKKTNKIKSKVVPNKMTLLTKSSSKTQSNLKNKMKKSDGSRMGDGGYDGGRQDGGRQDGWAVKTDTTVKSIAEATKEFSESENAHKQIGL